MNWSLILLEYLRDIVWVFISAIAMSISLGMVVKVFDWMTPKIDEQEELKKGNIAVGIVMGALIIAYGLVVGLVLMGQ